MPRLRLPGCRARPLGGYLKAIGLLKVVTEQVDRGARGRWGPTCFELSFRLAGNDLTGFLLSGYRPTPIVSPWNGRSGFYRKANPTAFLALRRIENSRTERLAQYRDLIALTREIIGELGIEEKPDESEKRSLIRALRRTWPDEALEWLDAVIVPTDNGVAKLPILGTGGNEGSYDFSSNYLQALAQAFAIEQREQSKAWSRGALYGENVSLAKLRLAHLFQDRSPTSTAVPDRLKPLGNPWDLILSLEGAMVLAGGVARRHASSLSADLVPPFAARRFAAGYSGASAVEPGFHEVWLPLWHGWSKMSEIEALIREGRVFVGRRQACTGLDFMCASGSLGVAQGIHAFERYVMLQRAGEANISVPAGTIEVRERPSADALRTLASWIEKLRWFARGECPRASEIAIRHLEQAVFKFADYSTPSSGCAALAALGGVETALARSGRHASRNSIRPPAGISAKPWLASADDGTPEFAAAVALASLRDLRPGLPGMRDYLNGTVVIDEQGRRRYPAEGSRAIEPWADWRKRLAAIHVRRHLDAGMARPSDRGQGADGLAFDLGIACPLGPVRALAAGSIDGERLLRLAAGLSILDFADTALVRKFRPEGEPGFGGSYPLFEALALAWAGTPDVPLGPRRGWAAGLCSGSVESVLADALLRLRMAGLVPLVRADELLSGQRDGLALAAALLLRLEPADRSRLTHRMIEAVDVEVSNVATMENANAPLEEGATR